MERYVDFNLAEFMFSRFSRVDFGGDLFGQWPVGIRFEIGTEQVSRATKLYEFTFAKVEDLILVSQDWKGGKEIAGRSFPLFKTPGIFPTELVELLTLDVFPLEETNYRLTWMRISPLAFDAERMFQAIANREQLGSPKIRSGVYVIDPNNELIMHMYDDRGLDVIAVELDTLRPLFETFGDWVLDNQRHKIEFRFQSNPRKQPQ
jgi:hypothetical protein